MKVMKDRTDETLPMIDDGKGCMRGLTEEERQRMRRGELSTVAPSVIKALLRGGRIFSISERG